MRTEKEFLVSIRHLIASLDDLRLSYRQCHESSMGAPSQDRQHDAQTTQVEQAQGEPLGQNNTSINNCVASPVAIDEVDLVGEASRETEEIN